MKMDVQGFEVKVLKGAKQLLAAGAIGILKTEIATNWLAGQGTSAQELLQIMASNGYGLLNGQTLAEINPQTPYSGVTDLTFQLKPR